MSSEHIPPRPDGPHVPSARDAAAEGVEARPTATWRIGEAVAIYVLALLVGGLATLPILGAIEDEDLANLTAAAVAAVVIVGAIFLWLSRSHPGWRRTMGVPPAGWWSEIRSAIGFGLLLYPGMVFGVGVVVSLVLGAVSGEPVQAPEQVPGDLSLAGVIVTVLYAVVIAPVHEELFFRGVLFQGVRDRYGLGAGLLATGFGFSLIHYLEGPWQDTALLMAVMFFNGIALAWYLDRRGTVVAPVVAHMVFNVIGLTLIFALGRTGGG